MYKGRLVIPKNSSLIPLLLQEHHDSPLGGHSGDLKTYKRIATQWFWPGMRKEIQLYTQACHICQQNKQSTLSPGGLLQSLPIPTQVWEEISMDFVEGLPLSKGKDAVLVVVDRLTKYAHFLSIKHPYNAPMIAELFTKEIIRLHGTPTTIISDRDKIFLSNFWKEIFKLQGSALHYSTAYHPQSDGQTEVVNKSLESYLRCFINGEPKSSAKWLHWAEYWYNTSLHSSTKCTPFKALYGRDPPHLTPYTRGGTPISTLEEQLVERDAILDDLKAHLIRAQQLMKSYEDGKRRDLNFEAGDLAYLKLQPYRQRLLAKRRNEKLAARYYGPFEVLEKVGPVAYRLKLPEAARIHPVFHVSQLKRSVGPQLANPTLPPQLSPELILEAEPEKLLNIRAPNPHTGNPTEVLIQWKHLLAYEATWEDFAAVATRFPHFHLEDKVALLGGSNARYQPGEKLITYARKGKRGSSSHLLEE